MTRPRARGQTLTAMRPEWLVVKLNTTVMVCAQAGMPSDPVFKKCDQTTLLHGTGRLRHAQRTRAGPAASAVGAWREQLAGQTASCRPARNEQASSRGSDLALTVVGLEAIELVGKVRVLALQHQMRGCSGRVVEAQALQAATLMVWGTAITSMQLACLRR